MNVAVTGVAHWHASMHLQGLQRAGASIVGIHDDDGRVAAATAEAHATRAFDDLAAMVRTTHPDLVIALGTPAAVLETAGWLIEARIPCIVEKPIGLTGEDVARIADAAETAGTFVSVPLVNRYSTLWRRLEGLADEGRAGTPVHANFRVVNGPPERYRAMGVPWMLDAARSGGGCLRNLGIHGVHAFQHFVGGEAVDVVSCVVDRRRDDMTIETYASATLRSASGVIGTVEAGYTFAATKGGDTEWRVATTNAYLLDRNQSLRVVTLDDGADVQGAIPSVADRYDEYVADTLQRLQAGRAPLVTLADYVRATMLVDDLYAAAAQRPKHVRP